MQHILRLSGAIISIAIMAWTIPACAQSQSPAPPAGEAMSLDDSMHMAVNNRGEVQAAERRLIAARQSVIISRSPLYPQVDQTSTLQELSQRRTPGGTSSQFSHDYSLNLSQLLFDTGQTSARVAGAEAGVQNAEAGLGSARTQIAFQAASAYLDQLRQQKLLDLAKEQLAQSISHMELIQARVDVGQAAAVDLQPVRVELAQAKFNLVSATNNAKVAQVGFRNALGLGPGPAIAVQDLPGDFGAPAKSLDQYVADSNLYQPDLQQAEASVRQAHAASRLANIKAGPILLVNADYSLGLFNSPLENEFLATANLNIPIFNGGGLKAAANQARASLQADQFSQEQLKKDVSAAVESAYDAFVSASERKAAADALVEQARANLDAATEKYRLGTGIALEIVDAQVQYLNAKTSAIGALCDSYLAKAALDQAIGYWSSPESGQLVAASPAAQ